MAVDLKAVNELEMVAHVRKAADEAVAKVQETCRELRNLPAQILALISTALVVKAHSFVVTRDPAIADGHAILRTVSTVAHYAWSKDTGSENYYNQRREPRDDPNAYADRTAPIELEVGRRYHVYTIMIAGNKD